ncbi:YmaF family protein [Desulfosporosinus sp. OT]|uniref:YmaF family protein n=1 Tax=Desulfosporosinus sp. OT TaxID=913865 RepID=UPI000A00056D|nr:YmaF family protein [Desulfosporosinus sp. OT]
MRTDLNHVHCFCFITSVNDQHSHTMAGTTSCGIPYGANHVHCYKGVTSCDRGHVHCYFGMTGPALYLADGSHVHCHRGTTSLTHNHIHHYCSSGYPSY